MYNEYNDYNQTPPPYYGGRQESIEQVVSSTMKMVYVKMTLGLLVTALTAWFAAISYTFTSFMYTHPWMMWVFIVAEFALVIGISSAIEKISNAMATAMFYLFAFVNGLMLFTIFCTYEPFIIAKTFMITAGTFAAMSVYGYTTSKDLTKVGSYLMMALFGLIIAMLVNLFMKSQMFDWIISIAGVAIFIGLTAWDTQAVKRMAAVTPAEYRGRLATIGALNLYLDFINLFLYLLRIFGGRR